MASSIQKIDKAFASINKGSDKKEEMMLMMGPITNWDSFLVPASMTIALLGQLILVSADTDFSLEDKKNEIRFQYLKYPDSFRACLVQVSDSMWGAFNKAHTCMNQIHLYSGNVDGHVRRAVKFLVSGSPQEVELMLPNALESIENIADECVTLARSVEEEFVFVMEMVTELLKACARAKGQYDEELKETEILIEVANEYQKAIEQKYINEKIERMGEVLANLAKLNLKKIDLENIRKVVLVKEIRVLGELREQWGKRVRFHEMMFTFCSNSVKFSLQSCSNQMKLAGAGLATSVSMRHFLFEQAFRANQIAYVVNSISSVYVEVSDQHLMDRITCLGKLIALDAKEDRHEIQLKREELNRYCDEAQEAIKRIADKKKKEILEAFDKRIGRIEQEVEAIMLPMPEAEVKKIQAQAAIDEEVDDLV